jgi:putative (di)nucleoside polyphosphate hydrolase
VGSRHFRAGVVIVVRRSNGEVLAFERVDFPGQWQLPQGGLESGEFPEAAAWRELGEETGLGPEHVALVGEHPEWTVYEWPRDVVGSGARLGQAHRWFFFEPLGSAELEPTPDGREFGAWQWVHPDWLVAQVVSFRRPSYVQVLGGSAS